MKHRNKGEQKSSFSTERFTRKIIYKSLECHIMLFLYFHNFFPERSVTWKQTRYSKVGECVKLPFLKGSDSKNKNFENLSSKFDEIKRLVYSKNITAFDIYFLANVCENKLEPIQLVPTLIRLMNNKEILCSSDLLKTKSCNSLKEYRDFKIQIYKAMLVYLKSVLKTHIVTKETNTKMQFSTKCSVPMQDSCEDKTALLLSQHFSSIQKKEKKGFGVIFKAILKGTYKTYQKEIVIDAFKLTKNNTAIFKSPKKKKNTLVSTRLHLKKSAIQNNDFISEIEESESDRLKTSEFDFENGAGNILYYDF